MSELNEKPLAALLRDVSALLSSMSEQDEALLYDKEFNNVWHDVDKYANLLEESD